jgi:hypothetical protein
MTTMHAYSPLYFSPQLHPKSCDHVTLGLRDHHRRPRMSNDRLDSVDGVLVQYLPGLYFHGTNCTVSPSTESEYEKTVICASGNPIVGASCHSNTRVAFTIHRLYLNMLGNSNNKNCRCNCTTICVLLLLINKGSFYILGCLSCTVPLFHYQIITKSSKCLYLNVFVKVVLQNKSYCVFLLL